MVDNLCQLNVFTPGVTPMKNSSLIFILLLTTVSCKSKEKTGSNGSSHRKSPVKAKTTLKNNKVKNLSIKTPHQNIVVTPKPSIKKIPSPKVTVTQKSSIKKVLPIMKKKTTGISPLKSYTKKLTHVNYRKYSKNNNSFAVNYLKKMDKKDENSFFSPFSIRTAFSIIYSGAKGKSKEEIKSTMYFNSPVGAIHQLNKWAETFFKSKNPKTRFAIGNEFQISNLTPNPKYKAFVDLYYNISFTKGDYSGQRLDVINKAIFKGKWSKGFKRSETRNRIFFVNGKKRKSIPIMAQKNRFLIAQENSFNAIVLPYVGGKLEMIILLPKEKTGINKLLTILKSDTIEKLKFRSLNLMVYLPKFKISKTIVCDKTIKSLGITKPYNTKNSDFNFIYPGLYIEKIWQKLKLSIKESGTEAKAVTTIRMSTMSAGIMGPLRRLKKPREFKVDHPFVLAIRDTRYKTILFLGKITNP
jgi:serine protease inhibitor